MCNTTLTGTVRSLWTCYGTDTTFQRTYFQFEIFPLLSMVYLWCLGAYRMALRRLRHSVTALDSFVVNHLEYQHADDVRVVNSVSVQFDHLVLRLVHFTHDMMDRYHVSTDGRLSSYEPCDVCRCVTVDTELLLAGDLSKLLSDIRTASQIISLSSHWTHCLSPPVCCVVRNIPQLSDCSVSAVNNDSLHVTLSTLVSSCCV